MEKLAESPHILQGQRIAHLFHRALGSKGKCNACIGFLCDFL